MDFDFSPEQLQLRDVIRRFLAEHGSSARRRTVLDKQRAWDGDLWQGLADLGVLGITTPEEYGGSGLGYLELCIVAEELGRAVAAVPYSSCVYFAAELLLAAGTDAQKRTWLPRMASGEAKGTLAVAEPTGPIGSENKRCILAADGLTGTKQPVPDGEIADFAIVSVREEPGTSLYLVDLGQAGIVRTRVGTIDPLRGYARIDFSAAGAEPLGASGDGERLLAAAMDKAAILTAFEQIGGADRTLEMARDFALERMAFGRQIGSFQAIKHMLADMYVEATLARSNAYYGAWALSIDHHDLPLAAARARVSANHAFRHCARNAIQVHGGMGFTWEHDCHLYFRRANLLAQSLGSPMEWERKLIDNLRLQRREASAAA